MQVAQLQRQYCRLLDSIHQFQHQELAVFPLVERQRASVPMVLQYCPHFLSTRQRYHLHQALSDFPVAKEESVQAQALAQRRQLADLPVQNLMCL